MLILSTDTPIGRTPNPPFGVRLVTNDHQTTAGHGPDHTRHAPDTARLRTLGVPRPRGGAVRPHHKPDGFGDGFSDARPSESRTGVIGSGWLK